jgi:DNA-binding winged helix-turn-helix (wHTH) protein
MLRMGDWCVNPKSGQISRDGDTTQLEERAMRLLLCLAGRPGEVVSIDDLLTQAWSGVTVSQDSVYQAVATLRRQLGDDSKKPAYIATVPRLGYRMVARQCRRTPRRLRSVDIRPASRGRPERCFASRFVFRADAPAIARQPQKSIAVLPFLDLTEQMNQEPFADGMTEELIDKFSKIPGLRVPPPTSSFYFQGQTDTGRRHSQDTGRGLHIGWERAQIGRYAAGCCTLDSRGQWVRGMVRNIRPAIERYLDGARRHCRRSHEGIKGIHRSQTGGALNTLRWYRPQL